MSFNRSKIIDKYGDGSWEDQRAVQSRAAGLEFHYTKKFAGRYIKKDSSVVEIGCATGYYGMYFADKCRDYLGIDLVPGNIALFKQKIEIEKLENVRAAVGDAINLPELVDESFDVVMALGPMYHLPKPERDRVFEECKRICKTGGILMFAYINKAGAYLRACLTEKWAHIYPNEKTNRFVLEAGTDDEQPDVFYFTMPEEIERQAVDNTLVIIANYGTDITPTETRVNDMTDEQFKAWMQLSDFMSESPSCIGLSNHALLICRKP